MRLLCSRLFLCLSLLAVTEGACSSDDSSRPDKAGVQLPVVSGLQSGAGRGSAVIRVTRDGRVLLEDRPVSIDELIAAIEKEERAAPCELRADGAAPWMHVQWVMAALGQAGQDEVRCMARLDGGRGPVRLGVRLNRGLWVDKFPDYVLDLLDHDGDPETPSHHLGLVGVLPLKGGQNGATQAAEYHFGDYLAQEVGKSRLPDAIRTWAASFLERTGREKTRGVRFAIGSSGEVPYRHVAAAIAELRKAGVRGVEVGLEALHPWDRDKRVLPPPPHKELIPVLIITDLAVKRLYPVNLPVAAMSQRDMDDDPDDRLILNLTSTGRLIHGKRDITLSGLATVLRERAQAYDMKKRARGSSGYEDGGDDRLWSKLYVLLRADRDSSLQHVRWVMAELSDNGYYKLQFATRKVAGRDRTPKEAERLWAAWEILGYCVSLEAKLQCWLRAGGSAAEETHIDVELVGSRPRYRLGAQETTDAEELVGWIRDAYPADDVGVRILGRITAPPKTRFGFVIAALNSFHNGGIEIVDLAGVERAPERVRAAERLPSVD